VRKDRRQHVVIFCGSRVDRLGSRRTRPSGGRFASSWCSCGRATLAIRTVGRTLDGTRSAVGRGSSLGAAQALQHGALPCEQGLDLGELLLVGQQLLLGTRIHSVDGGSHEHEAEQERECGRPVSAGHGRHCPGKRSVH
jgi:hypothetical protein